MNGYPTFSQVYSQPQQPPAQQAQEQEPLPDPAMQALAGDAMQNPPHNPWLKIATEGDGQLKLPS
jgi:hypothetical protein